MILGTKTSILGTINCSSNVNRSVPNEQSAAKLSLKKKVEKGKVSLQRLFSTTRFKYRYLGKVYFLTIPAKKAIDSYYLEEIRKGIEADILFKNHDNTQIKYKKWLNQKTIHNPCEQLPPFLLSIGSKGSTKSKDKFDEVLLPSMDVLMIDFMRSSGRSDSINLYHYSYRMIANWLAQGKAVVWNQLPQLLNDMNYAPETYNNRRYVLNLLCNWLVKRKGISYNPFEDVVAKKRNTAKDPRRKRLTDLEIKNILDAIRNNSFLKSNNRGYTHSHYFPIFSFLAYTGCRPAEAIGLKVCKIDFNKHIVTIDSAFARTRKGTSFACRIMKTTKTNSTRELPFGNNFILYEILKKATVGKHLNDFVFEGPNGPTCDDRAMNDSILKVVCNGLKIQQRILYCFRHSFCSRCFEQGLDLKTIQVLTGHKDVATLLNIYAEVNQGKLNLPSLII